MTNGSERGTTTSGELQAGLCPTLGPHSSSAAGVGLTFGSWLQDGVGLPGDAPYGPGGGLLSSAQRVPAVPGAVPRAPHRGATPLPQVSGGPVRLSWFCMVLIPFVVYILLFCMVLIPCVIYTLLVLYGSDSLCHLYTIASSSTFPSGVLFPNFLWTPFVSAFHIGSCYLIACRASF